MVVFSLFAVVCQVPVRISVQSYGSRLDNVDLPSVCSVFLCQYCCFLSSPVGELSPDVSDLRDHLRRSEGFGATPSCFFGRVGVG